MLSSNFSGYVVFDEIDMPNNESLGGYMDVLEAIVMRLGPTSCRRTGLCISIECGLLWAGMSTNPLAGIRRASIKASSINGALRVDYDVAGELWFLKPLVFSSLFVIVSAFIFMCMPIYVSVVVGLVICGIFGGLILALREHGIRKVITESRREYLRKRPRNENS